MRKSTILWSSALLPFMTLLGCGAAATPKKVSGVVVADAQVKSVSLKDSSTPSIQSTLLVNGDGAFSFDVSALTSPFVLKAEMASGPSQYAIAQQAGRTNLSDLSTIAVAIAAGTGDADDVWSGDHRRAAHDIESIIMALRLALAPLFEHYGITFGEDWEESAAFRTMLSEVSFTISAGRITMSESGGTIVSSWYLRSVSRHTATSDSYRSWISCR